MNRINLKKETKILWCLYRKRPDSLFIPIDYKGLCKIVRYAFNLGFKEQMDLIVKMPGGDVEEKATQLSQKYFPAEANIFNRDNAEAIKCKMACIEMAEWIKAQNGK